MSWQSFSVRLSFGCLVIQRLNQDTWTSMSCPLPWVGHFHELATWVLLLCEFHCLGVNGYCFCNDMVFSLWWPTLVQCDLKGCVLLNILQHIVHQCSPSEYVWNGLLRFNPVWIQKSRIESTHPSLLINFSHSHSESGIWVYLSIWSGTIVHKRNQRRRSRSLPRAQILPLSSHGYGYTLSDVLSLPSPFWIFWGRCHIYVCT